MGLERKGLGDVGYFRVYEKFENECLKDEECKNSFLRK